MQQLRRRIAGALVAGALIISTPGAAIARPSTTSKPPVTEPLPAEIKVKPDSDVLGQRGVKVAAGLSTPPKIPATGWMIVDLTKGDVLAADNARAQLMPASTIKTLTALTFADLYPDDKLITAGGRPEQTDGTRVGISIRSVYRVTDLLHGLLMSSGNDIAVALADSVGGDANAAQKMTAKAHTLGATDTEPKNTSGLDASGQVTSARDLALFGRATLANPRLAKIVATQRYMFPGPGKEYNSTRTSWEIYNHNKLLGSYQGALGVKNGFTVAARGSFIGAASRNGRTIECVLLHSEGRVADVCRTMLDWAFRQSPPAQPVTTLDASIAASAPPSATATATSSSANSTSKTASNASATQTASTRPTPWWWVLGALAGFGAAAGAAWAVLRRRNP